MTRAPFNVLVIPFRLNAGIYEYAVFHRSDVHMWQFIAGGGEDDEAPLATAKRETNEEAGIDQDTGWAALDASASIPRNAFPGGHWPAHIYVITEHSFAVRVQGADIRLSHEHDRFEWLDYDAAATRLTWDSNRVALWELQERLR
ncbi:MAG: NUDIX pyrophosphatase [Halieaceae bacterium]|nr:NUDIX pyrophosphatase [Halieaceae bacterium]